MYVNIKSALFSPAAGTNRPGPNLYLYNKTNTPRPSYQDRGVKTGRVPSCFHILTFYRFSELLAGTQEPFDLRSVSFACSCLKISVASSVCLFFCDVFFSSRFGQLALMPSHYGEPSLVLALLRSIFGFFCSSISAAREVLLYESPFPERVSGLSFLSPLDSPLSFWLHCTTFSQGCQ